MKKIVLSICIPTANRASYLRRAIDSIILQQPYTEGKIEIVISDNSSGEETQQMILKEYAEDPNIRYFKNECDMGNINFAIALGHGRGIYRKLSNDTLYYKHRSLADMVHVIEGHREKRPVLVWKIYQRIKRDYISTNRFEEAMRSMSYWSTWIASYGIWEDEAPGVIQDCLDTTAAYRRRFLDVASDEPLALKRRQLNIGDRDQFWQLRYFQKMFENRGSVVLVDAADNWMSDSPPKKYGKGAFKWIFYDYYTDILHEFRNKGLIPDSCVADLKRDLVFSYLVQHMVAYEFHDFNIEYESGDSMIDEILSEYGRETYYDELCKYYQSRRDEKRKMNHKF